LTVNKLPSLQNLYMEVQLLGKYFMLDSALWEICTADRRRVLVPEPTDSDPVPCLEAWKTSEFVFVQSWQMSATTKLPE
jgi:hypothetical protein